MGKAAIATAVALTFAVVSGCKKQEEQPPPGYGQPYPQQQPGQPPQQPGYGQPAPAGTAPAPGAAPGPAPAGTAPAAGGQMSQPNAMAFPCQTDAQCFTHRCNTQFGKCAWPCQTDADCTPGNKCAAPQCVPATQ